MAIVSSTTAGLISSAGRRHRWVEALVILRDILVNGKKRSLDHDTECFVAALKACARAFKWAVAVRLMRDMREASVQITVQGHNSLLGALTRVSLPGQASRHLKAMRNAASEPDVSSYQALLGAYVPKGWWQHSLATLSEMSSVDLKPDAITYCAVLSACSRGRQGKRALSILQQAEQEGIRSDAGLHNTVVCTLAQGTQWIKAIDSLSRMRFERLEPQAFAINAVLRSCSASNWKVGQQYLGTFLAHCFEPDLFSYSSVLRACAEAAQWESALVLCGSLRARTLKADALCFSSVLRCCAEATRWFEAVAVFEMAWRANEVGPIIVAETLRACAVSQAVFQRVRFASFLRTIGPMRPRVLLTGHAQGEGELALFAGMLRREAVCSAADDGLLLLNRVTLSPIVADLLLLGAPRWSRAVRPIGVEAVGLQRCGGIGFTLSQDAADLLDISVDIGSSSCWFHHDARAETRRRLLLNSVASMSDPSVGVLGVCSVVDLKRSHNESFPGQENRRVDLWRHREQLTWHTAGHPT